MSHTSGPWTAQKFPSVPMVRRIKMPHGEADTFVATVMREEGRGSDVVCRLDFSYGKSTNKDDARLMAAAPELLEALKAIVRGYDGPTVDAATAVSSHMQAARMAIKKAEGE